MSKKQKHLEELSDIFNHFPNREFNEELYSYIRTNSNLPGPRGNLELAAAFEETISNKAASVTPTKLWELCSAMVSFSVEEASVNDPKVLIVFCGIRGLGAIGTSFPEYDEKVLVQLRNLAQDSRWRVREAVAMALQNLLSDDNVKIRKKLEEWIKEGDWLVVRGVVAGIAEPRLLENSSFAEWALEVHVKVIDMIAASSNRKSEEFRTLRQALGYTLSVVVKAIPASGFRFLEALIERDNNDIKWIIRENLKKKRLVSNFPKEVDFLIQHLR